MSCRLDVLSSNFDGRDIRKKLFPEWKEALAATKTDDSWSDVEWSSWDEKPQDLQPAEDNNSELAFLLQECVIAISPVGDVMVIAHRDRAVFLTLKWDNNEEGVIKEKFFVNTAEVLTDDEEDTVMCILCLPLSSQKRSLHGRPDWTAIIIGFYSGTVKMFTESGILLFSQKFHEEPVSSIKCRTFEHPRHAALAEQHQELVIFYKKAIVVIDGLGLYQMLRACRNQVAKATASGNELLEAPLIAYKKWGFQNQEIIEDCESVGIVYSNLFDNMMVASLQGFSDCSSSTIPTASLFQTTGQSPYLGFAYAVEGSAPSFAMEVVAVATQKLKSLFHGIFGMSKKPVSDKKLPPKIELATPLPNRFELRDQSRLGRSICISPNRRLSVITDDFGRVILIDNVEGLAVRIWKGYRDAQCGWVEAEEDQVAEDPRHSSSAPAPRIALFLVIYGPRRGILEVWAMQQGPRVAAFNVSKSARLLCCSHGILGFSDVKSVIGGRALSRHCYLLEADGQVKAIFVPFHCALSASHSRHARDTHLLKNLKTLLKENNHEALVEDGSSLVLRMKTASVRNQALDFLIHHGSTNLELLTTTVFRLVNALENQPPEALDLENKLLLLSCRKKQQLLHLYKEIGRLEASGVERNVDEDDDSKPLQVLSAMLHICETEVDELLGRVDKFLAYCRHSEKAVHFDDDVVLSPGKFLTCFQTQCTHLPKVVNASSPSCSSHFEVDTSHLLISLKNDLDHDKTIPLAWKLYHYAIHNKIPLVEINALLLHSGIEKQQLLKLLIDYWLQLENNLADWNLLQNFHNISKFLSALHDPSEVVAGYNEISPWWSAVRYSLSRSENTPAAFTAALVCRGVAVTLATCQQQSAALDCEDKTDTKGCDNIENVKVASEEDHYNGNSPMEVSLTDWEKVDLDTEQWSVLVKQLEDVMVLNTLLKCRLLPALTSETPRNHTDQQITVAALMEKGRGAVSELVAVWMTHLKLDIILQVVDHFNVKSTEQFLPDSTAVEEVKEAITQGLQCHIEEIKGLLDETRRHFPRSLHPDVLIANCCWEFAAIWNKDKDNVNHLHNAIVCLKQVSMAPWGKGLASFLWHTFMSGTFRLAALLMDKVGKIPKERLCRKEIGMSDVSLEKFIGCCVKLLDILMRTSYSRELESTQPFQCEEPWQNATGPFPLVDVAVSQNEPKHPIVSLHYKLALSMHMILVFGLKSSKTLSLYDSKSLNAFFKDLHSGAVVPEHPPDLSIVNNRTRFLFRVISAAVQSIPEPVFSSEESTPNQMTIEHSNVSFWIGKITELASLWNLENDELNRHYVCELYSSGLDLIAEEILPTIVDRELLSSQLLLIAGQRIYNAILACGDDYLEKLAMFPPTITAWLTTLNQNSLRCPRPPLTMTESVIAYIINIIPEHQAAYKLAVSLIEPLQQFISNTKMQLAV